MKCACSVERLGHLILVFEQTAYLFESRNSSLAGDVVRKPSELNIMENTDSGGIRRRFHQENVTWRYITMKDPFLPQRAMR